MTLGHLATQTEHPVFIVRLNVETSTWLTQGEARPSLTFMRGGQVLP